jgi:hypothetical protein
MAAGVGPICLRKARADAEVADGPALVPPRTWPITEADLPTTPPSKFYQGCRVDGRAIYGRVWVNDREGAGLLDPGYELYHLAYHSPTGFAWGYGGSGPADLARSILLDAAGIRVADMFYQRFKREVVAFFGDTWEYPEAELQAWLHGAITTKEVG